MKFSKRVLSLLAILGLMSGGISCSLIGLSSKEGGTIAETEDVLVEEGEDSIEEEDLEGDDLEDLADETDEGFDEAGEESGDFGEDSDLEGELEEADSDPVAVEEPEEPSDLVTTEEPEEEVSSLSEVSVNIKNIQFLADQRGGTVAITGDSPMDYRTRLNQSTNQYIVEISDAFLPESLRRPFIMKDFKSAQFGAINAYQKEGANAVSVIVQMKSDSVNPSVEQDGNVIYVIPSTGGGGATLAETSSPEEESQASPEEEAQAPEEEGYEEAVQEPEEELSEVALDEFEEEELDYEKPTSQKLRSRVLGARSLEEFLMNNNKFYGKKISVTLQDVVIGDAIGFISAESGANLAISSDVKGTVTIKLRDVPWDQALVTLLRMNKLGYVRQGNVIRISTLDQLQAESHASKSIIEAQKALLPVHVRVIPVSDAKVEDLQGQLTPFLTPKRGQVVVDARTSSIILTDTEDILDRLSALIKRLGCSSGTGDDRK